jgi:hypothetical protein
MDNLNIKYQLPSGEWHELELDSVQLVEALVEKGADGVLPMLVTTLKISSKSQCGKTVKTTLLNKAEFGALTEIE